MHCYFRRRRIKAFSEGERRVLWLGAEGQG